MKGSEAVGTALRVEFSAPQHCSTSQVSQGTCGDPVSYYIVEWDTSDGFNSAALSSVVLDGEDLLLREQRVTTTASSAMSGTFQLAFNGETTPFINAAASAEELRSALEMLNSITTTAVSRDYAVAAVGGGSELDVTFGSQSAECSSSSSGSSSSASDDRSCDFNFSACQLVRLEGVWYRVKASFEADGSGQVSRCYWLQAVPRLTLCSPVSTDFRCLYRIYVPYFSSIDTIIPFLIYKYIILKYCAHRRHVLVQACGILIPNLYDTHPPCVCSAYHCA